MSDTDRVEPYPSRRRRQSQQHEAREQIQLKAMLEKWADPNNTFWTMLENKPRSAIAGLAQRRRGARSGIPDLYCVYRGNPIHVELKSPIGTLSKAQRQVRLELLASGAQWFLARSANAAMIALARSGVEFREIERPGGTVERWQAPELADWEQPQQNLGRHPSPPELTARRREAKRRQRAVVQPGGRVSRDREAPPRHPSS